MRSLIFLTLCFLSLNIVLAQTTYTDIAPILFEKCAQCHRDGGGAPFSVLEYDETFIYRSSIYHEVSEGYMPPWAPDTSYMHFIDERILTQSEKEAILSWVDDYALPGDTSELPPLPEFSSYILNGEPDLIINTPVFASNAFEEDAYNTLVIPSGLESERYIRAIEIVPENPELTHHVLFNADYSGVITQDLSGSSANLVGEIYVGIYTPGGNPIIFPNTSELKMGVKLPANADFVIQIHTPNYVSTGPSYGLDVNLQVRLYLYPENELGIREVFSRTPLQYWGEDFYIEPNEVKTFSAESEPVETNISIYNALPHSHKICTEILNYASDGNDTIPLIKIDQWDFNHQQYYYFENMVKIPSSYKFYSEHKYDNTVANHHNPYNPPELITVGLNSNDEMLFDTFQMLDYQEGDENINIDSILQNDPLLINSTSVNDLDNSLYFNSYVAPNPVINHSAIYFPNLESLPQTALMLKVFDSLGRDINLKYQNNRGFFSFNKGKLSSGVYFYSIYGRNRLLSEGQFLIAE